LPVLADAGVLVQRACGNEPGAAAVDALADAIDRHLHRTIGADDDLMERMLVAGAGLLEAPQ